ncbi:PucR family transcriptional regulator [Microbacterium sp. P06]|uniref:PucR family transcriptional regulator n=1 Tax=Microbacterium sp. P06 TaxID=3366949 RepID=UPI00374609C5
MNASPSTLEPDEPPSGEFTPRASLVAQLLEPDPDRRRGALAAARNRRWIDLYNEVTVRAVIVDGDPSSLREFEHALTVTGRSHTLVIDDGDAFLLLTSPQRTEIDIEEWTRTVAARAGVTVVAPIRSAVLGADEDDLQRAAEDARATTELLRLMGGDAVGTTRAEDLGMWRLLHGMTGSPELVAAASPAADELWHAPDQMRRITVEAYLDAGCSVVVACRALFIHRTTLYYRLESMSDTVSEALADGMQRSTLHLGLKLLHLWDSPKRSDNATVNTPAGGTATITPLWTRQASKRFPHSMP